MTENLNNPLQNLIPAIPPTPPVQPATGPSKTPSFSEIKSKIRPLVKDVFDKIKNNKKLYYFLIGMMGLIVIITAAGIIYKVVGSMGSKSKLTPTPTPQSQTNIPSGENLSPLDKLENDLKAEKVKIDALDVKQLPLTPLVIDYKIKF